MRIIKAIVRRLALIGFGICLALLVLEAVLQIGAAFTSVPPERQLPWIADRSRMLCLGDSNTYGLWLADKSKAYPKMFEQLWNADPRNARMEVLNLGFPGMNSSKLVHDFRRMLWAFRPDIVTVMIGVNDYWTLPVAASESVNLMDRLGANLWKVSRVYRLLYIAGRALRTPQLSIAGASGRGFEEAHATAQYGDYQFDLGWLHVPKNYQPPTDVTADLKRNARALAEQAKDFGVRLVFLTYPADAALYRWANATIRDAAREPHIPLIDVAEAFRSSCPGSDCAELFPDHHPTEAGHERVARILLEQLTPASTLSGPAKRAEASAARSHRDAGGGGAPVAEPPPN